MSIYPVKVLNEELEKLNKTIDELHEGIAVYTEILEASSDNKKKAESIANIIKSFETDLSLVQLQRFVLEARIKNAEDLEKTFRRK